MMNTVVRTISLVLGLAAMAYAAVLGWVYVQQEHLLFFPSRLPAAHHFDLPGVTEVQVPVAGGEHLSALHFRQPDPKGIVFFLHGNAGDLAQWLTSTEFYRQTGYDLFMIDYRSYGKSRGQIQSEDQLHADVRAAWDLVASRYAGKKVVLYGRSLGTALAARLAAEVPADLLVLVSPYSSMRDMAAANYPWVPLALLRYPLRTDDDLRRSQVPALILHGEQDELIPLAHAVRLQAVRPGVELVPVPQAGHNDIHLLPLYTQVLTERLKAL